MDIKKTAVLLDLAERNDGYVSVSEAADFGVAQTYLCSAEEDGLFQKISKGLYLKKGYPHDRFYEVAFRYRKTVFARRSALYLHGLLEEETLEANLPSNYLTSGISGVRARHAGKKEYELGISLIVTPRGNLVNTYDLERTLIDVLRDIDSYTKEELLSIWEKAKEKSPYQDKMDAYASAFHVEGELSLMRKLY